MDKDIEKLKKAIQQEKRMLKGQEVKHDEARTKKQLKKELLMLRMKRQNPTLMKVGGALKRGFTKLADNLEKSAKIDEELRRKKGLKNPKFFQKDDELNKLMYGH